MTPNHALQRTDCAVTLAASSRRLPLTTQQSRQLRRSLSLRSFGDIARALPIRTIMKSHFLWIIFLVGYLCVVRAAETPSVELQLRDQQVALTEPAQQQLRLQALQLLETSNFHSGVGDTHHIFNLPDVQRGYRTTAAGKFLLVSFPMPQRITTVGGDITVTQIIVGLNRDDYASSLFTIDESGIVVGHSKYSGECCIDILKAVKQLQQ